MTNDETIKHLTSLRIHSQNRRLDKDIEALDKAIEVLEQTQWIPVSERLPEDYQRVLVTVVNYNGDKVVRVAEYHDKKRFFQIKENHEQWEVGEKGLLAWRPLPEPYKA